ncbi:MAG: LPS export ABC transporter periplasmic protein LptC [Bacteroidetes bacterium]|nr:LPS export ABC transporter periplasmic protein LptC [Bacteroidota bacterium]
MIKRLPHITALILATLWLAAGCENDIERINMLTNDREMPTVNGTNVKVIYSDSGRVKVQILAPTYKQFPNAEKPYMEFPDGMEVFFYNDSMMIESEIRSDYSIYYTSDRLWHATGNVVAHRLTNGDALNTEELFWDEEKQLIYSNVYTRVQNEDNTLYGKGGFEAQQNLDNWFLKGTSGEIMVSDEE